jgi:hypothetical protein
MSDNKPKLEEVFKTSGLPTHTFVEPKRYGEILLNLRTPGRCLVVEGPSGIGKTTAIEKALASAGVSGRTTKLSARRREDVELIEILPHTPSAGVVLVDDFHRLSHSTQSALADYLKVLADTEDVATKIVVLGINRAGDNLISFAPDLVNRIDIVRFETEPDWKVEELLRKGSDALNVVIEVGDEIVREVRGSFYLTQMLAREICLTTGALEKSDDRQQLSVSFEAVRARVWDRLSLAFNKRTEDFCRGAKLRREGRAPYLHILNWLATGQTWTLDLRDAIRQHSDLRGSVTQVVDKGFLKTLVESNEEIRQVIHFDANSELLTVEDPQYLFYIRNISWRKFARELGYMAVEFDRNYDFALSFSGAERSVAADLFDRLTEHEVEVFYDKNEQHRILAQDIEEYLRPIYHTDARFVVVLLSRTYPKRVWTRIESEAFRHRFADGSVIPVWFTDVDERMFDSTRRIGGFEFDPTKEAKHQVAELVDRLLRKLGESRATSPPPEPIID